jgi:hypothetical protein
MCFTGMILLNGLIGIFGHAFISDAEAKKDREKEEELEDLKFGRAVDQPTDSPSVFFQNEEIANSVSTNIPFLREVWAIRHLMERSKETTDDLRSRMQKLRVDVDALKKHTRLMYVKIITMSFM